VAPTSQRHYSNFTRGPLSAYLHLCGEQGLEDVLGDIEWMGRTANLTDDDIRVFLGNFRIDPPAVRDAGAVRSVRSLLADIEAARPLAVRTTTPALLLPAIRAIAAREGMPTELGEMALEQQMAILEQLDEHLRRTDAELWRTKQVNDFLNGVWAQSFGLTYNWLVVPILWTRNICRIAVAVLLAAGVIRWVARRKKHLAAAAQEQPA
jgi:hypothetical protein